MTSQVKRTSGNTVELSVVMPWPEVKQAFDRIFETLLKSVEMPGFRKGKAPKELASKQINRTQVYEEVLKELVPQVYAQAVKENGLKPIISPKVEVTSAEENKDWELTIKTCEKPLISLGKYKEAVIKLKAEKKAKIWVPGADNKDKKTEEVTLAEVLETISKEIKVELSELILEQEVNRQLSNLVNETQKLGLTVEQYLQSQGKTQEQLREDYRVQAEKTLALEFALEDIADAENVQVENVEIDTVIKNAKDEAERKLLEQQRYYLGSLIRRQKTLSALIASQPVVATS